MFLRVHALDNIDVLLLNVDLTLVDVVACNEESGFRIVALEKVKNMAGKLLLRTVIVGQGDSAWSDASEDTSAAVRDVANLCAVN